MSTIVSITSQQALALPAPRVPVRVRPATMEDFDFVDALQKQHGKQLGYMPRAQIHGKIALGHVLVAELADEAGSGTPVGYVVGNDRYYKRDDCGIIYQLCVAPGARRGLIGAMLIKALFDRAAYGCRLFCCWCAQDIEANRFWESLGFVPLAYRAGSDKKITGGRVHIFWQKRIRPGDVTTPWWFPAKTDGGAMREDRIALPIPPGMRWSDELPVLRPAQAETPREKPRAPRKAKAKPVPGTVASPQEPTTNPGKRVYVAFGMPTQAPPPAPTPAPEAVVEVPREKPRREKRKADPTLIAAARELRDRWLEQVEENPALLLSHGKYDVARELEGPLPQVVEVRALPAAA